MIGRSEWDRTEAEHIKVSFAFRFWAFKIVFIFVKGIYFFFLIL